MAQVLTKKFADLPLCVIAPGSDKLLAVCQTPKGHAVSAKDWLAQIMNVVGGKGGGSPQKAQGTGSPENQGEAIRVAHAFIGGA